MQRQAKARHRDAQKNKNQKEQAASAQTIKQGRGGRKGRAMPGTVQADQCGADKAVTQDGYKIALAQPHDGVPF